MTTAQRIPSSILMQCLTTPEVIERFWLKVARCPHGHSCVQCCWLWQARHVRGYGQFDLTYQKHYQSMRANRISWMVIHGVIPDGLQVLHNCPTGDNPRCVNPAHLWLGTSADNQKDAARKGRKPRGTKNHKAILTEDAVHDIRYLSKQGIPSKLLGGIFGVRRQSIEKIVAHRTWAHLTDCPGGA